MTTSAVRALSGGRGMPTRSDVMFRRGVFVAALAAAVAARTGGAAGYLLLIPLAFAGAAAAVEVFFAVWLIGMLSPALVGEDGAFLARFSVIGAVVLGLALRILRGARAFEISRPALWTAALGLLLVAHSLVVSHSPGISVLKAALWTTVAIVCIEAWARASLAERTRLVGYLYGGLAAILVASVPLLFLPEGYLVNETGFQGILNHPQAFGCSMAILAAWSLARIASDDKVIVSSLLGVAAIGMVALSESRTAGLALVIGLTLTLFSAALPHRWRGGRAPASQRRRARIALGVFALLAIGTVALKPDWPLHFLTKSGRADAASLAQAYDLSRGLLIADMVDNIERSPMLGIGFGVSSDPGSLVVAVDPVLGIPVSASVEKGVIPIAVVEELGFAGAIAVLLWLLMVVRTALMGGLQTTAVCFTVLTLNLGEAVLFSPGGFGLIVLVLLGWTVTEARARSRAASPA